MTTPCTCNEHRDGENAPTRVGKHSYQLHEDHRGWRWLCGCGSRGQFTLQSPNVPYHSWMQHVIKTDVRKVKPVNVTELRRRVQEVLSLCAQYPTNASLQTVRNILEAP